VNDRLKSSRQHLLLSLGGRRALVAVNEDVFVLLLDGLVELGLAVELGVGRHID
jgi:hypothetical protein